MAAVADLHLHTTASDGRLSPARLVQLLAAKGVRYAAITDHDSTEGLAEVQVEAANFPGLTIIPGIELSTDTPDGEVHVLGLFLDWQAPQLQRTLEQFREGRVLRARRMVEKLNDLGVHIQWERVQQIAGGAAIGRPHIALAMVEKGYVSLPKEAFDRYISREGPAYVEREKLTPEEAIQLLRRHRALPVLAHPGDLKDPEKFLSPLRQAGLAGMEVFYGNYDAEKMGWLLSLAHRYQLLPCGGSDYHGLGNPGEPEPGSAGPPQEVVDRLFTLAGVPGNRSSLGPTLKR